MSTRELVEEADRAALAYQLALTKLGAQTMIEAIRLFARLNPTQVEATKAAWLADVIKLISANREDGRRLAIAYYRLSRALRTGRTIADPFAPGPVGKVVTLAELRDEFERLTQDLPGGDIEAGGTIDAPKSTLTEDDPDLDVDPEAIEVEVIEGLKEDSRDLDLAAEAEAKAVLEALGPDRLKRKQSERESKDIPAKEAATQAAKDIDAAALASSSDSARIAQNGGRQLVSAIALRDERAIGWVRQSRTGTPCGWCAMLISRGLAFYTSQEAATSASGRRGLRSDGERYHDNCQCVAVPVYSRQQYATSNLYDINRRYAKEWPEVTKGLSGKAAVSAWRRYIRQQQAQSLANPASRAA